MVQASSKIGSQNKDDKGRNSRHTRQDTKCRDEFQTKVTQDEPVTQKKERLKWSIHLCGRAVNETAFETKTENATVIDQVTAKGFSMNGFNCD